MPEGSNAKHLPGENKIREVNAQVITDTVARLCIEANYYLDQNVLTAFKKAKEQEVSPVGKYIFDQLIENANIASTEQVPICQDTGFAVVFIELGQDVHIINGNLADAINAGVKKGYEEGYLRKSIVAHPFKRTNTGDNTPAVIHYKLVPGDKIKVSVYPKGGGSENMSGFKMLKPAEGIEGVKKYVLEQVIKAGSNPCPPIVVGIGIGGTFIKCAALAQEALLRPLGQPNPDTDIAALETKLLEDINKTGIGPQGLKGLVTALAVHIEIYPTHIASLPVAVNINCHAIRHKVSLI
ncbi:MAG: fumarate hydratase [Carboxydocellales bacterium]